MEEVKNKSIGLIILFLIFFIPGILLCSTGIYTILIDNRIIAGMFQISGGLCLATLGFIFGFRTDDERYDIWIFYIPIILLIILLLGAAIHFIAPDELQLGYDF